MGDALDMCWRTRYALRGKKDLYHIETEGYIDFAIRQKYRIAKQYIDKSTLYKILLRYEFRVMSLLRKRYDMIAIF